MTEYVFTNNAATTLLNAIGGGDVTLTTASGDGAEFPAPASGEAFVIRVTGGGNSAYMVCTGRSSDVLTVTRTDSYSFPAGSTIKLVLNAAVMDNFIQKAVYATNAGSPDGSLVANYTGEECLDTTNNIWYKHVTGTTWKAMSGS